MITHVGVFILGVEAGLLIAVFRTRGIDRMDRRTLELNEKTIETQARTIEIQQQTIALLRPEMAS